MTRLQDMTLDQLWAQLRERFPSQRVDVTEDYYACSVTVGLGGDETISADRPQGTWTDPPATASSVTLRDCLIDLLQRTS